MVEVFPVRDYPLNHNLLIIDGVSGSGKTMISKLIDSAPETTSPSFSYEFEYFCQLYSMGFLNLETATNLIRSGLDLKHFNDSIAREINLRPKDLSSILKSTKKLSYLTALIRSDSSENSDKAMRSRSVLSLITHQLHGNASLVSDLYGSKFLHLVCIRHPYYLIDHWASYMGTLMKNSRDFTLTLSEKSEKLPWFIQKYKREYINASDLDRAALCVIEILEQAYEYISTGRDTVIVVDFEKFVLNPTKYLSQISSSFKLSFSNRAERILRRQLVPRNHINETKKLPIYERYASGNHTPHLEMRDDFHQLSIRLESQLEPHIFKKLKLMSEEYFSRFGVWYP